jgi:RHS repeat-associated protein
MKPGASSGQINKCPRLRGRAGRTWPHRSAAVIPDSSDNPVAAGLALTAAAGIGAYVGVPVLFTDGRMYGMLCSSTSATGSDTYLYDEDNNRTKVVEDNGATSSDRRYCYDALDQLIYRNSGAACSSGANDEAFSYDDAGNRLTATAGGVTTNFAYTAEGLLCDVETAPTAASCSGGNVTSDTAGRISAYAGWTYGYDAVGRLVSACKSPTCTAGFDKVTFAYDGEGHRTQIVETAAGGSVTTTDFRYQGDAVVEESVNGSVARRFTVDDTGRIATMTIPSGGSAGTYLVTWNGHGDATGLWQENGDGSLTLANSLTYGTWGDPTTTVAGGFSDLGFRYLYVGAGDVQWDDGFGLGLLYMHARHYGPGLGRFLQPDPARSESTSFAYARNAPTTLVDPLGFESLKPNPGESAYCLIHAVYCPFVRRISDWADKTSKRIFGSSPNSTIDGPTDACRHCLWQAVLTLDMGVNAAQTWGALHEGYRPFDRPSPDDRGLGFSERMDLFNNKIGRRIGSQAHTRGLGRAWIIQRCTELVTNRSLIYKDWQVGGSSRWV